MGDNNKKILVIALLIFLVASTVAVFVILRQNKNVGNKQIETNNNITSLQQGVCSCKPC